MPFTKPNAVAGTSEGSSRSVKTSSKERVRSAMLRIACCDISSDENDMRESLVVVSSSCAGKAFSIRERPALFKPRRSIRSEEHTSELQSLMRISYAVFCLKKKRQTNNKQDI